MRVSDGRRPEKNSTPPGLLRLAAAAIDASAELGRQDLDLSNELLRQAKRACSVVIDYADAHLAATDTRRLHIDDIRKRAEVAVDVVQKLRITLERAKARLA